MGKNINLNLLRIISFVVLFLGAIGSVIFTLNAGRNNKSLFLVTLFIVWVLSPFVILMIANNISKGWLHLTRTTLYILIFVLTIVSLFGYSGALSPRDAKPAGVFLIIPLISWVLIASVIPIVNSRARKN